MQKVSKDRNFWLDCDARHPYYYPEASVQGYGMSLLAKEQPEYVCGDCAREFSYYQSIGMGTDKGPEVLLKYAEKHSGTCECCGATNFDISHVSNYGYFYDGWQYKNPAIHSGPGPTYLDDLANC